MLKLRTNVAGAAQSVFSTSRFTSALRFTSSATNSTSADFMVDYLVNSLGFSKEEAIATSAKVSRFSSPEQPNSVVHFLKEVGLDDTQIRQVVYSVPKILSCGIDKNLRPKMGVLQGLGLSGSDLADVISMHPGLCNRSLNHIVPTLEALRSVIGDNVSLVRALKLSQWMLAVGVARKLPLNVALLQKYGLSDDKIETLLCRDPRFFLQEPEYLEDVLIRVEERFKVPRDSPMFYHAVIALSVPEGVLESKINLYKSFGWTDSDILTMVGKNPYCLVSSDSKIRKALGFYMERLGRKPADIARRSYMLSVSLEKRVFPRYEVVEALKEKGLFANNSLFSYLVLSEPKFFHRFVQPFKSQLPNVYENYMRKVNPHVKAAE